MCYGFLAVFNRVFRFSGIFSNSAISLRMLLIPGTGNGERGTGNGERGTGNGERGPGTGDRGPGNRGESGN